MASEVLRTVRETAADLFEVGVIDKATMREFDLLCLAPAEGRTPGAIGEPRLRNRVSQPVSAAFPGVGAGGRALDTSPAGIADPA